MKTELSRRISDFNSENERVEEYTSTIVKGLKLKR
jgi:hypothetical protein